MILLAVLRSSPWDSFEIRRGSGDTWSVCLFTASFFLFGKKKSFFQGVIDLCLGPLVSLVLGGWSASCLSI